MELKKWAKNYVNEYTELCRKKKKNLLKFLIIRNFTDQKKKKKCRYVLEEVRRRMQSATQFVYF